MASKLLALQRYADCGVPGCPRWRKFRINKKPVDINIFDDPLILCARHLSGLGIDRVGPATDEAGLHGLGLPARPAGEA